MATTKAIPASQEDMIDEQIDGFNVEIGRIDLLADTHLNLLAPQISGFCFHVLARCTVERREHRPAGLYRRA